ncbi:MAG: hypothetical protein KDK36_22070 [Leptospiraceae bacterium]|nr:hypothetical protein [Leptospiraceae bacterium]
MGDTITKDIAEEIGSKLESSITDLDDKTKQKVINTHRKRVATKIIKKAELQEKVETAELKNKLESYKFPSVLSILKKGLGHYAILLNNNIPATLFMTFIALGLILAHTVGMAGVLISLKANPAIAYPLAFVLSSAFEISMTVFVIDYKHKQAKLTMYSVILAMTLMAFLEMYYRKPDNIQWSDALKQVDIITWLRLISGSLMIPVVKSLAVTARDSGRKNKQKTHFDRSPEDKQKSIFNALIKIKKDFDKSIGSGKKWTKISFTEFSNAYKIYQHSLKDLSVKMGIFNKAIFKDMPKEKNLNEKLKLDPILVNEVVSWIDTQYENNKQFAKVSDVELQFATRGLDTKRISLIYKTYRPDFYLELHPRKQRPQKDKSEKEKK